MDDYGLSATQVEDLGLSQEDGRFEPHSDDDEEGRIWEVEGILAEKKGKFLVRWKGTDENGKPWPDSWLNREDITDDVVQEWRLKQAAKKLASKGEPFTFFLRVQISKG